MEETVAPGTGLTPRQEQLLDLAVKEPYIVNTFYLSGGTALSSWYLHHRQSYDLDFFTNHPFDYDRISRWIVSHKSDFAYDSAQFDEDYGFLSIKLSWHPGTDMLKIDFHHYAGLPIKPGPVWRGLKIDSLYDIAVNKIDTIATLPRTRDYVDIYCIFQSHNFFLKNLVTHARKKFRDAIDPLQLMKNFLKVKEYTDLPKMLIPFDPKEMETFYEELATSLKRSVFQ